MIVRNNEYNFSFEMPDEYDEIARADYPRYHIDPSTLNVFVKMDNDEPHTISLNRDANFSNQNEYLELIQANEDNMKKISLEILNRDNMITDSGRRIDIILSAFRELRFYTFFTGIRDMLVVASIEVDENTNPKDTDLYRAFSSIIES